MDEPVQVGVIGTGVISNSYLERLAPYEHLVVKACADLDLERARAQAQRWGVPHACTPEELLADPEIELVGNFTVPRAHADVALAAIRAGKSVYNEKPFAHTRELGQQLLREADEHGVRIGGAPDTFLCRTIQTLRHVIDGDAFGKPVGATAIQFRAGPNEFHPDPAFFFQLGGGPLLDLGPYTLVTLIALFGPVARVTGSARTSFPERRIGSGPLTGQTIDVEVPTHFGGLLEFTCGAIATLSISWDVVGESEIYDVYELHGTNGTIMLPEPHEIAGTPRISSPSGEWSDVPLTHGPRESTFGIGIAQMAAAMRDGGPHIVNGELAYHVLDVMLSLHDAVELGRHVDVESTCARPPALPEDWLQQRTEAATA
jgi:predicted dehydrogenase